jgi:hypothetical protein
LRKKLHFPFILENDLHRKLNHTGIYKTVVNVPPPVGEIGNLGRDSLIGPDQATLNATPQKNTKISERYNLQFRWEVFNVFNRENFIVTKTSGTMRQMQFGLKWIFQFHLDSRTAVP